VEDTTDSVAAWLNNGSVRPAFAIPIGRVNLQRLGELVVVQGQIDSLLDWTYQLANFPPYTNGGARTAEHPKAPNRKLTLGPKLREWIKHLRERRAASAELVLAEEVLTKGDEFATALRNPLLHGHFGTATADGGYTTTTGIRPAKGHATVWHGGKLRAATAIIRDALRQGCELSLMLERLSRRL
jgi:hypothetical protein